MKRVIIISFLISSFIFAQPHVKIDPVFIEHHTLMQNNTQKELVSYRIPFDNLVFTKINNHYEAKFTLTFELFDSTEFVTREIKTSTISTDDYDKTKSNIASFQDFFELKISPGNYSLRTNLSINDADSEIKIPPQKFIVDTLAQTKIYTPIIVEHNSNKDKDYILLNYENSILYSPDEYDLLVGIPDTTVKKINYAITQFKKEVTKDSSIDVSKGNFKFATSENNIKVQVVDSSKNINIFKLSGFSKLLSEGKAEIEISYGIEKKSFPLLIKWIGKPKVLNNPEYAIKLLSYFEESDVVKELLSNSDDKYYQALCDYWNKNFPTKGSKYNYAMNEYYKRADYAIENFSSLGTNDGAESDRGQIYITYGKPSSIDRNYNEKNEIMEIWHYDKLGRTFIFKDTTGTGRFVLEQ